MAKYFKFFKCQLWVEAVKITIFLKNSEITFYMLRKAGEYCFNY